MSLADATRGRAVADPEAVRAATKEALDRATEAFPEGWGDAKETADFDVIEAALDRNIRVIPALVQDAEMPGSEELPDSLTALARRHVQRSLARIIPVLGVASLGFGAWYALGALELAPYYF